MRRWGWSRSRVGLPAAGVVLCVVAGITLMHYGGRGTLTPVSSSRPGLPPASAPAPVATPGATTLHYVSNSGTDLAGPAGLGYNLFDLPPSPVRIGALAAGQRALVWLGNLDNTNCTPGYSWTEFTSAVDRLAGDARVFGYYISDEPHPRLCPDAAADIRERADYIHARNPAQRVFIVVMDAARECGYDLGCEYAAMRPSITHVDLIGVDPFPCGPRTCDPGRIDLEVGRAVAAGVPLADIVPVFQVFGQECSTKSVRYYALPTVARLVAMLARWTALVPHPQFDFTYTWRSAGPACPALDRADGHAYADLQAIMQKHNQG